jgi:hypothetical protein
MIDMSKPYKSEEPVKRVEMKKEEEEEEEQYDDKFEEEAEGEGEEEEEDDEMIDDKVDDEEEYSFSFSDFISRRAIVIFLVLGLSILFYFFKDLFNKEPLPLWLLLTGIVSTAIGGIILYYRVKSKKSWW